IGRDLPLDSEAVALFVERARSVDPSFRLDEENVDSVSEICRRLDGLPLAIELAAARIRSLPVQEVARRLTGGTEVLGGGARDLPDRQRTLDSTIRWASDLLDEEERALFHGLSVFAGEFGLSTVEAVWPDLSSGRLDALDGLAALVDRALLQRPAWIDGEPRYAMLRTVRDHAARELERSGRGDEWRRRLTLHYSRWASDGARTHLCELTEAEWLERVEREHDNLRAILDWATDALPAAAAAIAAAVYYYWYTRGMTSEGRERIERILAADGRVGEELRARLVVAAGAFAGAQGDLAESLEWRRRGLEIYRDLGDPRRIGWALQSLGVGLRESGSLPEAAAALEEALALGRETGDQGRIMFALSALGEIALFEGGPERAEGMLRESLVLAGRLREPGTEARCLAYLGETARRIGQTDLAVERSEESLRIFESRGPESGVALASLVLADAVRPRDPGRADDLYARALGGYRSVGDRIGVYKVLLALAESAGERGDPERAARMLGGVTAWGEADGSGRNPELSVRLGSATEAVRELLGEEEFALHFEEGRTYSYERLIALADSLVRTVELKTAAS
ncbi:MAG TPA: tetratricopeptide repeat protein, partial [Candidatus Limnocylindrales bacterium]|nr:tetratricopeptide repeat protein [Candidatus Limnocylindrales bacterium]